jgi:hypothetical protein
VRSRRAGNAVIRRHGRRILRGAGLHHHALQVDLPRRPAVAAPATLVIEGRAPVELIVAEVGDVDAACASSHGVGMLVGRMLIERVDLRRLGRSARGTDLIGHHVELRPRAAREEHAGAFTGERADDGAADRSAPSVDHRVPVLEQQIYVLKSIRFTTESG